MNWSRMWREEISECGWRSSCHSFLEPTSQLEHSLPVRPHSHHHGRLLPPQLLLLTELYSLLHPRPLNYLSRTSPPLSHPHIKMKTPALLRPLPFLAHRCTPRDCPPLQSLQGQVRAVHRRADHLHFSPLKDPLIVSQAAFKAVDRPAQGISGLPHECPPRYGGRDHLQAGGIPRSDLPACIRIK